MQIRSVVMNKLSPNQSNMMECKDTNWPIGLPVYCFRVDTECKCSNVKSVHHCLLIREYVGGQVL